MNALTPVSFKKGRESRPRLSQQRIPGKHHARYWTEAELDVIRKYYPKAGGVGCQPHLPAHHSSLPAIYQQAHKLGLRATATGGAKPRERVVVPEGFEDKVRAAWAELDGRKRGEVAQLADELGVPRWWLTKYATRLGLTIAHKKEPPWTEAENALMHAVPLHLPDRCAKIFREHGFSRSPTAIVVRAKRLELSRRATRETLSATQVGKLLGIDNKGVTAWCISGHLPATRREDQRLPQQGGSAWAIAPADLRQFIIDNIEQIDLRKVDKFAFVELLTTAQERNND